MLMVLSPAKTLDFSPSPVTEFTALQHLEETWMLVRKMRKFSGASLKKLMSVSDKIADLNKQRYTDFSTPTAPDGTTKQALLAFKGDTYKDMDLEAWSDDDYAFAQDHLRILSGLYGELRPLDLIKPYRLEMGTALKTPRGKNLYAFWGTTIADALQESLQAMGSSTVVNLASDEYFKSVAKHLGDTRVVQPAFLDFKNGKYKTISFFAKRARGAMASWAIRQRITDPDALTAFDVGGYSYAKDESSEDRPVFKRDAPA